MSSKRYGLSRVPSGGAARFLALQQRLSPRMLDAFLATGSDGGG